jgi:enoyl-CoA hydratase/carnithine racemase
MANELIHIFECFNNEDEVRAIVVTGAGKAFCAGIDLTIEAHKVDSLATYYTSLNSRKEREKSFLENVLQY